MAGKRMAQHMRVNRRGYACLKTSQAQTLPYGLRTQSGSPLPHKHGCLIKRIGWQATRSNCQPCLQRSQGLLPNRNAAPLRAFAQNMRLASRQVYPSLGMRAGLNIQTYQFAHTQPAAVQQFHHR